MKSVSTDGNLLYRFRVTLGKARSVVACEAKTRRAKPDAGRLGGHTSAHLEEACSLCDPAARRAADRRGKSDVWHYRIENAALGEPEECSFQCPRPDSNGHARYGHRPSTCRVYQFHHGGNTIGIIIESRPLSNARGMVDAKQLALFVNSFEVSYTGTRFPTFEIAGSPDSPPASACQGGKACVFASSLTPAPRCPTSI
jgi:hypothetical protein